MNDMDPPTIPNTPLVFLKLGGSLITDKKKARSPRLDVMARLAAEIKTALDADQDLRLVLGHGSGSFGHVAAKAHGTRQGVGSAADWQGFVEVWYQARALNQMMIETLSGAGLPVIAFPASGSVTTQNGIVVSWDLCALEAALGAHLIPVVNGDVAFDRTLGGTILSTEDIFSYLAIQLKPERILLAGIEAGIWEDYPTSSKIISEITPVNWAQIQAVLGGSAWDDVTGGMASKARTMLALVQKVPGMDVLIFSGNQAGNLASVLGGGSLGTRIFDGE